MNLLNLEMMNAAERMAEALKMRGLFVTQEKGTITFTNENAKHDLTDLKEILAQLNIPIFWHTDKIMEVLVNRLPVAYMKKITNAGGRNFSIHMKGYHYQWRAFAQRRFGIKIDVFQLEPNMSLLTRVLNKVGIGTLSGCNGHHKSAPAFKLSGIYNGAWLKIVQKQYLIGLTLNYKWNIEFGTGTGAEFRAEKISHEQWDMNKIYQDTVQMALELEKFAKEIRELKNKCFNRSNQMTNDAKWYQVEHRYEELINWMEDIVVKIAKL